MGAPQRKKVLVITYYWPPSGGAGVQRWLKFTKYLREFNYEPVIYTAENPEYPSFDESLYKDIPENLTVLRTRVWEPYKLYKWFTFQKKGYRINTGFLNEDKKKGLAEKISVWIRGNWFIPDARKFWIKPSVRYLSRYLKNNPVDVIVSTGPPHSLHLIALKVAGKFKLPWMADFRDPWTKIDFYQDLRLSKRSDRKHHRLEKQVINSADAITVINRDMKEQFEEMGAGNIHLISNGFDPEDFTHTYKNASGYDGAEPVKNGEKFTLCHIGTIVPSRNPESLWTVLSSLVGENKDFASDLEIKLIGASDFSVTRSINENKLGEWVKVIDYLPHKDVISILKSSQVLLLLINNTPNAKGILTGKFFEYMNSGRPILAIGPVGGEVDQVIKETQTGQLIEFDDEENLKKQILEYYNLFKKNDLNTKPKNLENYSRKILTGKIVEVFNKLT